jgi:hypothetical protein
VADDDAKPKIASMKLADSSDTGESWLGLSEQLFGFDKWNVCRV